MRAAVASPFAGASLGSAVPGPGGRRHCQRRIPARPRAAGTTPDPCAALSEPGDRSPTQFLVYSLQFIALAHVAVTSAQVQVPSRKILRWRVAVQSRSRLTRALSKSLCQPLQHQIVIPELAGGSKKPAFETNFVMPVGKQKTKPNAGTIPSTKAAPNERRQHW